MGVYSYRVELDVDDNRAYTNGLCLLQNVVRASWQAGMSNPYDFISGEASLNFVLDNRDGRYDLDDPDALYYNVLKTGKLVRVRVTYLSTTVTMTELRIAAINPTNYSAVNDISPTRQISIVCTDRMRELQQWEYNPPLQENVRIDEVLTKMHQESKVPWPGEKYYFYIDVDSIDGTQTIYAGDDIDFDQARTSLEFVGDAMGKETKRGSAQQLLRSVLPGEVYGFYYFQPRTAKYCFRNRLHSHNTSSSFTFTSEHITDAPMKNGLHPFGEGPLNELELEYEPRAIGTAGSVIWTSDNMPVRVSASDWKNIKGRYRDPDNPSAQVGAKDVIPMTRDIDFVGNSKEDGTGEDWTRFVFIYDTPKASAIDINIWCRKVGDPVFMTTLQVRGTPLTTYNRESVTARDGLSVHTYGRFPALARIPITNVDEAQNMANLYVNTFSTPRRVVTSITMEASVLNGEIASEVQTLTIGSKVRVQNRDLTHNELYLIMAERHQVNIGLGMHNVTYVLRSADSASLFVIDTSSIDGTDILDL